MAKKKANGGAIIMKKFHGDEKNPPSKENGAMNRVIKKLFPKAKGFVVVVNEPASSKKVPAGMMGTDSKVLASGDVVNMMEALLSLEVALSDRMGMPIEAIRDIIKKAMR